MENAFSTTKKNKEKYMNKMRSAIEASGKKFRTKNISKRVQKIVISPIKEMSILADEIEEKTNANIISFGQGIPYFDTPTEIKDSIKKAVDDADTSKYTLEPGITELRELVSKFLEKEKGFANIKPKKEIMIGVGCQEVMSCAIASIIDDGDEVILPSPLYASHLEQVIQWGGMPIFSPLIENETWKLDFGTLEKLITQKTKAIIFSNPCNPTGKVYTKEELKGIVDIAIKHDLIVISDETYDFLTYDGIKHISLGIFEEARERIIVTGSFSKKYALTGYRVGYAFADEGIIDHMLKIHDALAICAPAISQKAAISALKNSNQFPKEAVKKFTSNREAMMKELDTLNNILEYKKPSGAYYILANIKQNNVDSMKLALKILNEANVIVIPGIAFGPQGENHIRLSFACQPENIKKGFDRLREWFKKWEKENYKLE